MNSEARRHFLGKVCRKKRYQAEKKKSKGNYAAVNVGLNLKVILITFY